jgi:hypothetical protein
MEPREEEEQRKQGNVPAPSTQMKKRNGEDDNTGLWIPWWAWFDDIPYLGRIGVLCDDVWMRFILVVTGCIALLCTMFNKLAAATDALAFLRTLSTQMYTALLKRDRTRGFVPAMPRPGAVAIGRPIEAQMHYRGAGRSVRVRKSLNIVYYPLWMANWSRAAPEFARAAWVAFLMYSLTWAAVRGAQYSIWGPAASSSSTSSADSPSSTIYHNQGMARSWLGMFGFGTNGGSGGELVSVSSIRPLGGPKVVRRFVDAFYMEPPGAGAIVNLYDRGIKSAATREAAKAGADMYWAHQQQLRLQGGGSGGGGDGEESAPPAGYVELTVGQPDFESLDLNDNGIPDHIEHATNMRLQRDLDQFEQCTHLRASLKRTSSSSDNTRGGDEDDYETTAAAYETLNCEAFLDDPGNHGENSVDQTGLLSIVTDILWPGGSDASSLSTSGGATGASASSATQQRMKELLARQADRDRERTMALQNRVRFESPAFETYRVCEPISRYNPVTDALHRFPFCWDFIRSELDIQFNVEFYRRELQASLFRMRELSPPRRSSATAATTGHYQDEARNQAIQYEAGLQGQRGQSGRPGTRTSTSSSSPLGGRKSNNNNNRIPVVDDANGEDVDMADDMTCACNAHFGIFEPFAYTSVPSTMSRLFINPRVDDKDTDSFLEEVAEAVVYGARTGRSDYQPSPASPSPSSSSSSSSHHGDDDAVPKFSLKDHVRRLATTKPPTARDDDNNNNNNGASSSSDIRADDDRAYNEELRRVRQTHLSATERDVEELQRRRQNKFVTEEFPMTEDGPSWGELYRTDRLIYAYLNVSRLVQYPERSTVSYQELPTLDGMIRYFGAVRGDTYAAEREGCAYVEHSNGESMKGVSWLGRLARRLLRRIEPARMQQSRAECYHAAYQLRFEVFSEKAQNATLRAQEAEEAEKKRRAAEEAAAVAVSSNKNDRQGALKSVAELGEFLSMLNPLSYLTTNDIRGAGGQQQQQQQQRQQQQQQEEDIRMPRLSHVRRAQLQYEERSCVLKCIAMNKAMMMRRKEYAQRYEMGLFNVPDPLLARVYIDPVQSARAKPPKKPQVIQLP